MSVKVIDDGATSVIAAVELGGLHYIRVRCWPAQDGFHYIPVDDIAALSHALHKAPHGIDGIGVQLVFEDKPPALDEQKGMGNAPS